MDKTTFNLHMPDKLEMHSDTYTNKYGKFILQPLEKGFGVTIGNSLRRVLLSSLSGSAFNAIQIKGVLHEFSTVPGVKEDVSELILNIKAIRIKVLNKKATKVSISLNGPGTFTAGDLQKFTSDIEILNPEQYFTTIEKDASLKMDLYIGHGRGFVSAEEYQLQEQVVGLIPIDAIYSPIINVKYTIEPTRVGQQTDFEKLILEVQTDGSITPDEALMQAAHILKNHIEYFIKLQSDTTTVSESDAEIARIRAILKTPIDELELSVRSHNVLRSGNIQTLGDLVRMDISQIMKLKNFGRKSLSELTEIVEEYGLTFGMDVDKYLNE